MNIAIKQKSEELLNGAAWRAVIVLPHGVERPDGVEYLDRLAARAGSEEEVTAAGFAQQRLRQRRACVIAFEDPRKMDRFKERFAPLKHNDAPIPFRLEDVALNAAVQP